MGRYPRIFDQGLNPTVWLDDYNTTYGVFPASVREGQG
jgi:hypothetical protein